MLKHMLKYILLGGKLMSSKELIKQLENDKIRMYSFDKIKMYK